MLLFERAAAGPEHLFRKRLVGREQPQRHIEPAQPYDHLVVGPIDQALAPRRLDEVVDHVEVAGPQRQEFVELARPSKLEEFVGLAWEERPERAEQGALAKEA